MDFNRNGSQRTNGRLEKAIDQRKAKGTNSNRTNSRKDNPTPKRWAIWGVELTLLNQQTFD